MLFEKSLIKHCSPTLASIKPASLFNIKEKDGGLSSELEKWNNILLTKGLSVCVLRRRENSVLVYVYRRSQLAKILDSPDVKAFLWEYGYKYSDIPTVLAHLRKRLGSCPCFPHEIGVFLGYPLEDVIGFIENEGKNSKCTGCWKVYSDAVTAEKKFAQYKKCSCVYQRLWCGGKSIMQLTVAA